jgi:hypothetical protein
LAEADEQLEVRPLNWVAVLGKLASLVVALLAVASSVVAPLVVALAVALLVALLVGALLVVASLVVAVLEMVLLVAPLVVALLVAFPVVASLVLAEHRLGPDRDRTLSGPASQTQAAVQGMDCFQEALEVSSAAVAVTEPSAEKALLEAEAGLGVVAESVAGRQCSCLQMNSSLVRHRQGSLFV